MSRPWEMRTELCQSIESTYPCPLSSCSKHNRTTEIRWTHSNCGGYFRLYENGKEKCQRCGEEDLFCNWNYSCNNDYKNQKFSSFKIRAILQFLMGLNDDNVSEDFWFNIKACFKKQKSDYPWKFNADN